MRFLRGILRNFFSQTLFATLLVLLPAAARADLILSLTSSSLSGNAGDTITFTGTVTNTTGVTLNASDMFLDFSGFDPSALTNVNQLLGNPDFSLPDHHISSTVDMFSVTIAPDTPNGIYELDVSLLDVNNDTSATLVTDVQVGSTVAPEPASVGFFLLGFVAFAAASLRATRKNQQLLSLKS